MKVSFAHVCDYASVSADQKLSVNGIFQRINVRKFPMQYPLLYLAYELELRPSELGTTFKLGIKLVDADGNKTLETEGDVKIDGVANGNEAGQVPQIMALAGLPLSKPGRYSFDIFLNGALNASVPFEVVLAVTAEEGPAGQGLRP